MNNKKPYSERTKYRKIAAEVAKVIQEAQDSDCDDGFASVSGGELHTNLTSECWTDAAVSNQRDLQVDVASAKNCMSLQTSSIEITDTIQICNVGDYNDDGLICDAGTLFEIESDDGQLRDCEPDEWTAREVDGDTDSDDNDSDTDDSCGSLRERLANWASGHNVPQTTVTDLLHILHSDHPYLPLAAKTLQHTKRQVEIQTVSGGEYYYFGLAHWLESVLGSGMYKCAVEQLTVHINIDGVTLFHSSLACLWPILCSIEELKGSVFPVALYCGKQKPKSIDEYMHDFIDEMLYLQQFGFTHNGKLYRVKLGAVICDAPARAFVKCIKGHSGYSACERCVQHGEYMHGKVVLLNLDAPLRTNASFISMNDAEHHLAVSPFTKLDCGMVIDFPLDYMHLVCLGVVRRIIHQWTSGRHCHKLSQGLTSAISDGLLHCHPFISREFSRKPRSLLEHKLWKATEFRLFLIYTGPVILKGFLAPEVYSNFMDLSVAIRILLSPDLIQRYGVYCSDLIKYFVESFCTLYGKDQMVYNVHSLVHLSDDVKQFGALDNVSAFQYESFLGRLVKLVRRPQQPCAQIVRRLLEFPSLVTVNVGHSLSRCSKFAKPHMEGPMPLTLKHYLQFKQYSNQDYFMSTSQGDNCFDVIGRIGLVRNIIRQREDESENGNIVFEEFLSAEPFFTDPIDSREVFVYFVSKLAGIRNVHSLNAVVSKYVLLPYKQGFVALRQMHQC